MCPSVTWLRRTNHNQSSLHAPSSERRHVTHNAPPPPAAAPPPEWRALDSGFHSSLALRAFRSCGKRRGSLLMEAVLTTTTQPKRRGHFSRCPKQYKHYCIKGRCRFVVAEQTPSCVCDEGYAGARCERVDLFYLRGDRGQILVICLIAVMVIFIILVVGVCTCCHPLWKHRERIKKEEEMETLVYEGTSRLVASYKIPYSFENGQTVSQENS
ncbi:tomoregulin-1-like [Megaptera novaeangliae]